MKMSQQEKDDKIDKMASEIGAIKRWYPVFLVLCSFAVIVFSATQIWDNTIAKKSDINDLKKCIASLSKSVENLKQNQDKNNSLSSQKRDSVFNKMSTEISQLKKTVQGLKTSKKKQTAYYIAIKRDPITGQVTKSIPVNN